MSELLSQKYKWINHSFFDRILKKKHPSTDFIMVLSYTVDEALCKGENYSSHMLRTSVHYLCGEPRTDHLIVKASLCDDTMQSMVDEFFVFERELTAYRDVLPRAEELLRSIGDSTQLAATAYELSTSPPYFVFEDLKQRGYSMADRKVGLTRKELELTLSKLARLHAATATMYKADPTSMKSHNFSNFNEEQRSFYPLFENSLIACADQAKKWQGFEKIVAKMYDLKPRLMKKGCQVYTRDESCFSVLTHGDLWVNNAMFRYDESGVPDDVMLVDYAVGYFGSPAIDLSYLLFTSCDDELEEQDFDQLLQHYHAELLAVLTKLNYPEPRPTLTDIQNDMLKKGIVGMIYSTFLVALRLVDDTADADLSNLLMDTETALKFREKMFQHPKYARRMQYMLPYYDRKGYLD